MNNKHNSQSNFIFSDEALETVLDEIDFVETPPLFTNKVMHEIEALSLIESEATVSNESSDDSLNNASPQSEWWQWLALIGGGIPALLQVLAFIFSTWNVASLG